MVVSNPNNWSITNNGEIYFTYSGIKTGDPAAPATVSLISIDNSGLFDLYAKITSSFGAPADISAGKALGILVSIDDISVIKDQPSAAEYGNNTFTYELVIPRGSKFEILSLNTVENLVQERAVTVNAVKVI